MKTSAVPAATGAAAAASSAPSAVLGDGLAGVPLLRAALEREVTLVERHLDAILGNRLLLLRAHLLRLLRLLGRLRGPRRQLELLLVEGDLGGGLGLELGARPGEAGSAGSGSGQAASGCSSGSTAVGRSSSGSSTASSSGSGLIADHRRGHGRDWKNDRLHGLRHERGRRDDLGRRLRDLFERLRQPVVLDRGCGRRDGQGLDRRRLGRKRERRDRSVELAAPASG